jgi:hypothetical protein
MTPKFFLGYPQELPHNSKAREFYHDWIKCQIKKLKLDLMPIEQYLAKLPTMSSKFYYNQGQTK